MWIDLVYLPKMYNSECNMKCKYYTFHVSGLTNNDAIVVEVNERAACVSNIDKSQPSRYEVIQN